jgi:hypothetical protein
MAGVAARLWRGRASGEVTWLHVYGRRGPCRRGLEGPRGLSPPGRFPGVRARVVARRPGQPGGWPSHQARARARPGDHAPTGWRKRCEGDKVRETDGVAPPVIKRKGKTRLWA